MRKDGTNAMRVSLNELLEWLRSNAPNCLAHLCSGASNDDMAAVEKLKPLNDKYPIPTFISILSKEKYLPFVFI